MLSKATQSKNLLQARTILSIFSQQKRDFSGGPYNPLHYKAHLVPEELPTYSFTY